MKERKKLKFNLEILFVEIKEKLKELSKFYFDLMALWANVENNSLANFKPLHSNGQTCIMPEKMKVCILDINARFS